MRFFKYGDGLAIVVPDGLRRSSNVKENDEFNWFEAEPGVFVLVSATATADKLKKSAFLELSRQVPANVPAPVKPLTPTYGAPSAYASKPAYVNASSSSFKPATGVASNAHTATERARLNKAGFLVLDNEFEAKRLSEVFASDIRQGLITGLRGFDKKFYILTAELSGALTPKIIARLSEGEAPLAELMRVTAAPEGAVQAVLLQLKEKGDLIEKKKNVFKYVG